MSEQGFLTLFATLFGMAVVWLVLVKLLFRRLELAHRQQYEAMGRPSLFLRNSPLGVFAMLKFLVLREHRGLNDAYLSRLSDGMLVLFTAYCALFFGVLVVEMAGG